MKMVQDGTYSEVRPTYKYENGSNVIFFNPESTPDNSEVLVHYFYDIEIDEDVYKEYLDKGLATID